MAKSNIVWSKTWTGYYQWKSQNINTQKLSVQDAGVIFQKKNTA